VLAGVVLVAAGLDAQLLSRISFASTAPIEETLLNWTANPQLSSAMNFRAAPFMQ
jgi:hypothetical protein